MFIMFNILSGIFKTGAEAAEKVERYSPQDSKSATDKLCNFTQLYGDLTINQLISEWKEIPLTKEENSWVNSPTPQVLEFVSSYPDTPFDSIPSSDNYLNQPSFLISQAHRLWQTTSLVNSNLTELNAKSVLDLGSFPFFASLILRDYFGFNGEITLTTNIDLSTEGCDFLESKKIYVDKLELDPIVNDPDSNVDRLPAVLSRFVNTFDLILSSHVIEHLYHPVKMITESARLLKSGG